MAKNDIILIDGIIDERIKAKVPSCDKGEALEYLANEQILKNFDLSKDELENGSVVFRMDGDFTFLVCDKLVVVTVCKTNELGTL